MTKEEMGRACSKNGVKINAYRVSVVKPQGQVQLGRPRCRWVENIKMYLREIGWGVMDWCDVAHYRDHWRALLNTVMNPPVL
jgi:hypothetical protein